MVSSGSLHHLIRLPAPVLLAAVLASAAAACSSSDLSVTAPTSAKCQVSVVNSPTSIPAAGGTGTLTVTTNRDCTWDATSGAPWVTLSGEKSGQGNGSVSYRVDVNVDPSTRRGTLTVNDAQVLVAQDAAQCRFTVSPASASAPADGTRLTVNVDTASSACAWTTSSDSGWLHVTPGSHSGSGSASIVVDANTGVARNGTVVVAGQSIRVEQSAPALPPPPTPTPTPTPPPGPGGCEFNVSPTQASIPATGGSGSVVVAVTAGTDCAWTASSDSAWLSISGASSGTGSGSVAYTAAASTSGSPRTGTLTIAGQIVTITQAAAAPATCTYSITPTSATVGPEPTVLNVGVTTQAGCGWTEQQVDSWLQLGQVSSGTGSGTAQVAVERYKGNGQRTGTMTIAGQTFTVTQTK